MTAPAVEQDEETVTIPRTTAEHIRTHLAAGCWAHADLTAALEDQ
jgi:hypothetical protein